MSDIKHGDIVIVSGGPSDPDPCNCEHCGLYICAHIGRALRELQSFSQPRVTDDELQVFGDMSMTEFLRLQPIGELNIVADYIDGEDVENRRLIGLLRKHGGHTEGCSTIDGEPCLCGWDRVESEGWPDD